VLSFGKDTTLTTCLIYGVQSKYLPFNSYQLVVQFIILMPTSINETHTRSSSC
jgi:hypothetical protein